MKETQQRNWLGGGVVFPVIAAVIDAGHVSQRKEIRPKKYKKLALTCYPLFYSLFTQEVKKFEAATNNN